LIGEKARERSRAFSFRTQKPLDGAKRSAGFVLTWAVQRPAIARRRSKLYPILYPKPKRPRW
jgi:hypothetical protein